MEAKVIKRFRDIFTNELHEINAVYEGDKDRVKELEKKGYVEAKKKKTRKTSGEGE